MKGTTIRNLGIALLSAVLLLTTACAGGSPSATPTTDPGNGGLSGTLKIAFFKGGYGDAWIQALTEKFIAENPGVSVTLDPDPQITEKMGPRLEASANLPDLAFILNTGWQQWAAKGYLRDLTGLYGTVVENGKKLSEVISPRALDYSEYLGKYYVVPWSDGVLGIAYNAGMFEQYGWTVPATMKELEEVLIPKILAEGITPFAWGGKVMAYWDFPTVTWWAQYQGVEEFQRFFEMASPDVYAQEGRLKALEQFQRLMSDPAWSLEGAMSMNHTASQMAFVQGKAAMMPNGSWLETEMKASLPEGFRMKMMPVPAIEGAKDTAVNYSLLGDFIVVPSQCASPKLAEAFLLFISREDNLRLYTQKTGSPRPFLYSVDGLEGVSEFTLSTLAIWKNSKNIYVYSKSPLYSMRFYMWPAVGAPYARIAMEELTAEAAYQADLSYVKANWEKAKSELGVS